MGDFFIHGQGKVGGGGKPELLSIWVDTPPDKVKYDAGDLFDPTGMVIKADISGVEIVVPNYTYEPEVMLEGVTEVIISYEFAGVTKTCSQPISAVRTLSKVDVITQPTKTAYKYGDTFDPSGMVVQATYSDGSTEIVEDYSYTPTGALGLNDTTVTVSYEFAGKTATTTFDITVARVLSSIAITTAPTKTAYKYGEKFSSSGMVVTATYTDGGSEAVSGWTYTPTSALTHSNTAITVSYTEGGVTKTATQAITISKIVTKIEVTTAPTTTSYIAGQTISTAGMVVKATYSDGSTATVTSSCSVSPTTAAAGTSSFTISYTYNGTTVTTTQAISIVTPNSTLNSNSWADIALVAAAGLASTYWKVGDTKTETLNGTTYTFRIVGFDHDNLNSADAKYSDSSYNGGKKKAAITFEMVEIFTTTYYMNSSSTNVGGWNDSYMRSTVMQTMKGYMSTALKNVLRTVSKLASAGNKSSTITTSADQLFLLSEIEVKGTTSYSFAGEGSQYAYYKAGNSAVKNRSGSAALWWLRSPRSTSTHAFVGVGSDGSLGGNYAGNNDGVSFGFCI